ncbi:MAG: hypothetical protein ABSH24_11870 [Bryobacteraceae bacterium]|jgi:hypothetical protein
MPTQALRFASLTIIACLAVTGFDIVTGLEHWPFGSYPMYSTLYSGQLSWLRLYGATDQGEIPLRDDRDFAPFDQARLIVALERLRSAPGGNQKLDEALRNLILLYNRRRKALRALRLYSVSWTLRRGLQGSEPPATRTLIAQVTAGAAEAGR